MAVHEWRSGVYQPKAHNISHASWVAITDQFKGVLDTFQSAHSDRWLDFSQKVFNEAKKDHKFIKPLDSPHVIPPTSWLPLDLTGIPDESIPRICRQQVEDTIIKF
jgi:hypothetical protein